MKNPVGMMTRHRYRKTRCIFQFVAHYHVQFLLNLSVQFLHCESAQEKRGENAGMLFFNTDMAKCTLYIHGLSTFCYIFIYKSIISCFLDNLYFSLDVYTEEELTFCWRKPTQANFKMCSDFHTNSTTVIALVNWATLMAWTNVKPRHKMLTYQPRPNQG